MLDRPVRTVDDQGRRTRDEIVDIASEQILARRIEKHPAEGSLDCLVFHDDEIVAAKLSSRLSCDFERAGLVDRLVGVLWIEHRK